MYRMVHQVRGGTYAAASVARHHNTNSSTRFIHNAKLVGLHNQLHQSPPEILRLHGLKLHDSSVTTGGTQTHQNIDVAIHAATLQNIKLVHLHDSLHQPPVEIISFRGLCLHDHDRYLQPMNKADLKTTANIVSQPTFNQLVTERISTDLPRISAAYAEKSFRDTTPITESVSEMPLLSKTSFGECIAALGEAMESLTWVHNGHPKEDLQSPQDSQTMKYERE